MTRLGISWAVLIFACILAVMLSAVFCSKDAAGLAVGCSLLSVMGYGLATHYYLGIRRHVHKHLGCGHGKWHVITHAFPPSERVNIQLALDHLRGGGSAGLPVFGFGGGSILSLARTNPFPQALEWQSLPRSLKETLNCPMNALYLMRYQDLRFCAYVRPGQLQILAPGQEEAGRALAVILDTTADKNIYRGSILSLQESREGASVRFYDLAPVRRDNIVLPQEVMAVVERNVLGLLAHAEALRRAGRGTRHGVLLYGPPGTGKTLVTRYLATACPRYTVILLTGRDLKHLRPSCQLARLLAPSMVVLEDVDLVASERRRNRHNTLLHELMDEMDGLGPKTDCIFLLTTNRPELLEPALAARPGRVDQAIYFPLPDPNCRRRLFALFANGLDLSGVDLEPLLERTEGASPAFLQEFFRKAALLAAERGEQSDPLRLTNDDFAKAMREIIEFGGVLTRNLLGFRPDATADAQRSRAV